MLVLTIEPVVYTTLTTTSYEPVMTVTVTTTLVEDLYVECATGTAGQFCSAVSAWPDTTGPAYPAAPPAPTGMASPVQGSYGYRK
jgi:hypothetical protein